jgi:hypothetical protein
MKLIDIDTGREYSLSMNAKGEDHIAATGKVYEKQERFGIQLPSGTWSALDDRTCDRDTHKALCFLEPIEKPMPEIRAGDYILDSTDTGSYIYAEVAAIHIKHINKPNVYKIYRHGKLIWSKNES